MKNFARISNGVLQLTNISCKAVELASFFAYSSVSKADGDIKHVHAGLNLKVVLAEQKHVKELNISISFTLVRNQDFSKTVLHFSVYLNQSCGKCMVCEIYFTAVL